MSRRSLRLSPLLVSALAAALAPLALAAGTTPVPGGNLTANPSFETNANGWGPWQATLTRTALTDAPNGSYVMKVARASGTFYTIDDTPDTVPNVTGGTKYTATAYVKAAVTASVGKPIRIVVRERKVVNGAIVKETSSTAVNLTTAFQKITVTHTGVASGEAVDMYVQQDGAASGSAFYADLISLTPEAAAPPPDAQAPSVPAGLTPGAVTATSAALSWTAATDNVGVTGYQVSLNGVAGATVTGTNYTFTGLACGTAYTLGVKARDAAGNLSAAATKSVTTGACPDTQAPSVPAGLSLGAVTATSAPLSWTAATDNVGVAGYQVSLNGVAGAAVTTTGYTFTGLTCGTTYTLGVKARDAAGNLSAAATKGVTTGACPDTQAPSAPTLLTAGAVTQTAIPLGWTASTDDVGVTGYQVSLNGAAGATVTDTAYTFTGLACGTTYTLGVTARDAAGNFSAATTAAVATAACPVDDEAPTVPTALSVGTPTATSLPLSGAPAADNVAVTGYQVSLDGVDGATITDTGYVFTGLACGTTYTLGVRARDAAGNLSDPATTTAQTAACPDTQAPSAPANLVTGTVSATAIPVSWEVASDDVGVTGYQVSLNGAPGATVTDTAYTFTGLSCGTTYTLGVRARDAAGNFSAATTASVATEACPVDDQAPSVPTALSVGTPTATSLPLSWTAATDNVAVTGYQVSLDGVDGATVTDTGYAFTGLACGTTYTLAVRARDAAGNRSDPATTTAQTAACPDTQAPSAPTLLTAGAVTQTAIPLGWTASTDDVGVTGYQVSLNGTPGATVTDTAYTFTGLACGTTYTLGVRARDAAGNLSVATTAAVATAACPPPPPGVAIPAGNLTANPSFETNTTGWGIWQATITRVAQPDAPVGAYVAKITRAAGTYYTIDDTPDTVPNVTGGTTYNAVAYVKAAAAQSVGKPVRIVVRERKTVNGALVKETSSSAVNLSSAYQKVTVSAVAVTSGEAVDMYVQQDGAVANDSFYVDAISLVAGTAAPPASPPPVNNPDMYGISYGYGLQNLSDADLNKTLSDWTELGVKWVRFDFDWSLMQPDGPNVTNFAPWDRVVTALGVRGIKVLGIIDYTPSWACGCNDTKMGPTDPTNFGNFAVALAQHYAPMGVHSWDIWNEQNNLVFWHPAPSIANYTALLKATAPRIRAADPQAFILNGGFSPASDDGKNIAPITFLKGMYAAGAKSSFDAVNDHPYAYPFGIQVTEQWSAWYQMFGTTPDSLRSVMIANGDADKKIWMTEVGAPTGGNPATQVTEAQQAQLLTDTYNAAKGFPWAGPVFWYSYWDRGTNPNDVEDHFGLVHNDYTRKPSFAAYKAVAHS